MKQETKRLAVIGGGAAGLVASIAAARKARSLGNAIEITVFEADDRVGRSILATGNGRCNFSNAYIDVSAYYNDEFVADVYAALQAEQPGIINAVASESNDGVHAFFESTGLVWREEGDGRRYPLANKASSVLDVLRAEMARLNVREACECKIAAIEPPSSRANCYTLRLADGRFERADAVVLACGGSASGSIELENVRLLRARPVLGPLKCREQAVTRELDNIRAKCAVSLVRPEVSGGEKVVAVERGEVMFRKYGVSGICVFNLSRFAWPDDLLRIDFVGAENAEVATALVEHRVETLKSNGCNAVTCDDVLRGLVLPRIADVMLKNMSMKGSTPCQGEVVAQLADQLSSFTLTVAGIADPSMCQVHRGGIDVSAMDVNTLAIKGFEGLYAAGEALDVDGPCGGYNLHWAWASGLLAGASAAAFLGGGAQ